VWMRRCQTWPASPQSNCSSWDMQQLVSLLN
jgi:hypothetical protein